MNAQLDTVDALEALAREIASCGPMTDDLWIARALVRAAEAVREVKAELVQREARVLVMRQASARDA